MPRIVSLLPSATEIVCALGAGDDLVGISHECDFPPAIRDRPVLTRSRIDSAASSRAIDTAVCAVITGALSIYEVDADRLSRLAPDLIVTQDLCEVCAVSLDDVRAAVARLAHRDDIQIVCLRAAALGAADRGRAVRAELERRIADIARRAGPAAARPRVVSIEWIDPVMLGGTWMPELIALAGGQPVGATAGAAAPTIRPAELAELAPDVVMVKPCGFTLPRALEERAVIERCVLAPCAGRARVYVTDGNAYFNRPGPRLVESLEILAACVHPDRFADFQRSHAAAITRLA